MGVLVLAGVWHWQRKSDAFPTLTKTADQNVLLVTIDTLRADALGCYGGRAATPNLDALARDGVRFTFAHAHAVMTLPSHASILTGRYPFDHGVRDNAGFRLDDEHTTLAEMAKASGFATGAFVGAFPLDRRFGLAQGFDEYDDVGGPMIAPAEFALSERRAEEVVERALAWIQRQQKHWLAWVHVFDPHAPYTAPPPFDRQYPGEPYAGEIAYVDRALMPLLDFVRRGTRPTTVLVTSDHGEGLGEHGETTHGTFAYESTLRIPLIVAQVGAGATGGAGAAVSPVSARHIDIVPTVADIIGLHAAPGLPGDTLLVSGDRSGSRSVYFEAMSPMLNRGWAPLRGLIDGRDKHIDLPIGELYDLEVDPREVRNLASSAAPRVRAMSDQLASLGATLPGQPAGETAGARARLQSLGYLSGAAVRKPHYTEDDDPKRLIDVDRLMIRAIELTRAGQAAEAAASYRQVIERRPDMNLAYRWLAFAQWNSGMRDAAINSLREALRRNGPDVEVETRLGTYLAESGAHLEAVPMLERASSAAPQNPETLNALGIAYARSGRHEDALRAFERIIAINPVDGFALENIGTVHLHRNDMRSAHDAFLKAAANDPRSSRAEAGLGVVALKTGRRDDAIRHWTRAVALDRSNFDALFNLASELVKAGRHAEARPHLEQFLARAPRSVYDTEIEQLRRALGDGSR